MGWLEKGIAWKSIILLGILPTALSFSFCSRVFTPIRRLLGIRPEAWDVPTICKEAVRSSLKRVSCLCSQGALASRSQVSESKSLQTAIEALLLASELPYIDHYNNLVAPALIRAQEGELESAEDHSWTTHLRTAYPRRPFTAILATNILHVAKTSTWPRRENMYGLNETDESSIQADWIVAIETGIREWQIQGGNPEPLQAMTSRLGLRGLLSLLGVRCTAGTVPCVPPDVPTLVASFQAPHSSGGKPQTLTVGARALAKHAIRSKDGWWGGIDGNDKAKNARALQVLLRILDGAVWINTHLLPEGFPVLEIRTVEGYGARWTADGASFRGFLEPQMPNGHEVNWRH